MNEFMQISASEEAEPARGGMSFQSTLFDYLNEEQREKIRPILRVLKKPALFEDEKINTYPLVLCANSIPEIAEKNRSRLFFESPLGFEGFEEMIKEKTGEALGELKTGGSVATDAFSLAEYLGFEKIILIGQDLAYTGGKTHVSDLLRRRGLTTR